MDAPAFSGSPGPARRLRDRLFGGLRRRFLLVAFSLLGSLVVTTTFLAARNEADSLRRELERKACSTGLLLEPTMTNWVLRGDVSALDQGVRAVRAQTGVVDARVLDDDGSVLADGEGAQPGRSRWQDSRAEAALNAREAGVLRHGDVLDAVHPLTISGERVGTLVVGFSLDDVERAAARARQRHLLTGLVFVAVGVVVTWVPVRRLTVRLQLLTAGAQDAATEQLPRLVAGLRDGGDLNLLAPEPFVVSSTDVVCSSDEVGQLARAFNSYRSVVIDMAAELTALLRTSDARLRRAFDASPIGMALAEPTGVFVEVNDALCAMLGRPRTELLGRTFDQLAADDHVGSEVAAGRRADDAGQIERSFVRPDGSVVWALHTSTVERDREGAPCYVFSQLLDTTERKRTLAEMAHLAFHDPLTGLANRARLVEVLDRNLAQARACSQQVAALLLDLDRFKLVNDSLGHAAGDELLRAVADRLLASVREVDTVGRLGGDEFVVVCAPGPGAAGAERAGRRILAALDQPLAVAGQSVHVSASVGIAVGDGYREPADLLREADTAAYAAKAAGRGTLVVFDDALRLEAEQRLRVEQGMRRGIDASEFSCFYQPLVEAATNEVVGFEALVRWLDGRQVRGPDEFLHVAEDTGLVVPLGRQVLRSACRQLVTWRQAAGARPVHVAVNVSPRQLIRDDFVSGVQAVLGEEGVRPGELCVEITEAALLQPEVVPRVRALRAMGVNVALDDFGTGYSSLGRLRELPVDQVKIDRSFVRDVTTDPAARSIITAVVELAHAIGLEVLAEGVERVEDIAVLEELGCDLLQGYALGRPAPAVAIPPLLARRARLASARAAAR